MQKDLLRMVEQSDQILDIIRKSRDKAEARVRLMAELDMNAEQVNSAFRIRLEMFTQKEITEIKEDIEKMEEIVQRNNEMAQKRKEQRDAESAER